MSKVRITQVKSGIDRPFIQKQTLLALGLKKLNQTVETEGTPQVMGMIHKVRHLVTIERI